MARNLHMSSWTRWIFCIFAYRLLNELIIKNLIALCVLNVLEDTSKPGKRPKQGPGDNISDIEHLLDDQPLSEFTWVFSLCLFGVVN